MPDEERADSAAYSRDWDSGVRGEAKLVGTVELFENTVDRSVYILQEGCSESRIMLESCVDYLFLSEQLGEGVPLSFQSVDPASAVVSEASPRLSLMLG